MNVKENMRSFAHKVGDIFDANFYNIIVSGAKLFMDIAILPGSFAVLLYGFSIIDKNKAKAIASWDFKNTYDPREF